MSALSEKTSNTERIFICGDVFEDLSLVPLLEQRSESVFMNIYTLILLFTNPTYFLISSG